jgi:general secretion pathway protein G
VRRVLLVPILLAACSSGRQEPAYVPPPPSAFAPGATADLGRIDAALRRYAKDHAGRLPATLDDLAAERSPDSVPYLTRVPRDPWGSPYDYAVLSPQHGAYDLRSHGPDRLPGTGDDVVEATTPVPTR